MVLFKVVWSQHHGTSQEGVSRFAATYDAILLIWLKKLGK